eukprot:1195708-Prorocentrum_minimum.AAC.6
MTSICPQKSSPSPRCVQLRIPANSLNREVADSIIEGARIAGLGESLLRARGLSEALPYPLLDPNALFIFDGKTKDALELLQGPLGEAMSIPAELSRSKARLLQELVSACTWSHLVTSQIA